MKRRLSPWLGLYAAALLCACPGSGTSNDAGTPPDAGVHDAGAPDAGIPAGGFTASALDGGMDTFALNSATVVWGTAEDGGLDPAWVTLYFSNLSRELLCDISRLGAGGDGFFAGVNADFGSLLMHLRPEQEAPGTYVVPDGGSLVALEHDLFVSDGGMSSGHRVSRYESNDGTAATLTLTTVELPVRAFGSFYNGGHVAASLQAQYPDGGSLDVHLNGVGCDGQPTGPGSP